MPFIIYLVPKAGWQISLVRPFSLPKYLKDQFKSANSPTASGRTREQVHAPGKEVTSAAFLLILYNLLIFQSNSP